MPDISSNIGSHIGSAFTHGFSTSGISAPGVRPVTEVSDRQAVEIASPAGRSTSADRVEVSEAARWLEEMNRLPAVREDKVAAARAAIANGTLDSDDNLSIALGRMIDEIG
jgi:anti-sigma28 factor (negative regulator of flagellin synthesis)